MSGGSAGGVIPGPSVPRSGPVVVTLDDVRARDADLSGSKAAALATAAASGLPVLPGFVLTTASTSPNEPVELGPEVRSSWRELSSDGQRALVVRSSSTAEDLGGSSMAGRYESVVDVLGWDAFTDAVDRVLASRREAGVGVEGMTGDEPLAVLVQPLVGAGTGGVLFGVDPVTGRTDRQVAAASCAGPGAVVSGEVEGSRYVLDMSGDVVHVEHGSQPAELDSAQCQALVGLAASAADVFGGPQDLEWAFDDAGRLMLLQSRPVTTEVAGVPEGPVLGPGPVAETFPEPLAPLEQDLWVEPLRRAIARAMSLAGAADEADIDSSPIAVCVGGRVAIDLELTQVVPRRSPPSRLDPRPRLRRLRAAWRVGRLRTALPGLAEDVVQRADAVLGAVPALGGLSDRQLLGILDRSTPSLVALHAHEVLMGQLVRTEGPGLTGTSVALRVLAHARERGTSDDEIAARHPIVLALTPPQIGARRALPRPVEAPAWDPGPERSRSAVLREALRLRARWFQELTVQVADVLGERLAERGVLEEPSLVRMFRHPELTAVVLGRAVPADLAHRADDQGGPPLPARFRLTDRGRPVAVTEGDGGGTGAGGGTGQGVVTHDTDAPGPEAVLVVRTLDPSLAPLLPSLAGLVAETGSVLAHIAILARESNVPTVVGYAGATDRFSPGSTVAVDGVAGEVRMLEEAR